MQLENLECNKYLLLFYGELNTDPRPTRIAKLLNENNIVYDICCSSVNNTLNYTKTEYFKLYNSTHILHQYFFKILRFLIPNKFKNKINFNIHNFKNIDKKIFKNNYNKIFIFDIYLLEFAINNLRSNYYIFDAREYYPRQFEDRLLFRIFEKNERNRICRTYLKKCSNIYTVSDFIKNEYETNFNIHCQVFRSLPQFVKIDPKINEGKIKVVHHGMANRNRKIENLINIFKFLNQNIELHLYLVGDTKYIEELKDLSKNFQNIIFENKVPFNQINSVLNKYDIGLIYFEPTTFNLKYCLPNKLFEFIQARLMIVSGPSPEIRKVIEKYNCGFVTKNFSIDELSFYLNNIKKEEINKYKLNSHLAAYELSYDSEKYKLENILN